MVLGRGHGGCWGNGRGLAPVGFAFFWLRVLSSELRPVTSQVRGWCREGEGFPGKQTVPASSSRPPHPPAPSKQSPRGQELSVQPPCPPRIVRTRTHGQQPSPARPHSAVSRPGHFAVPLRAPPHRTHACTQTHTDMQVHADTRYTDAHTDTDVHTEQGRVRHPKRGHACAVAHWSQARTPTLAGERPPQLPAGSLPRVRTTEQGPQVWTRVSPPLWSNPSPAHVSHSWRTRPQLCVALSVLGALPGCPSRRGADCSLGLPRGGGGSLAPRRAAQPLLPAVQCPGPGAGCAGAWPRRSRPHPSA